MFAGACYLIYPSFVASGAASSEQNTRQASRHPDLDTILYHNPGEHQQDTTTSHKLLNPTSQTIFLSRGPLQNSTFIYRGRVKNIFMCIHVHTYCHFNQWKAHRRNTARFDQTWLHPSGEELTAFCMFRNPFGVEGVGFGCGHEAYLRCIMKVLHICLPYRGAYFWYTNSYNQLM